MSDMDNKKESPLSPSRRSFLNILWAGLGIIAAFELIIMVINFLGNKKSLDKPGNSENIIDAGNVDGFTNNSVTANIRGKFYLCRMAGGGFIALSSKCTHLGCTVPWNEKEKRFICPCHGSSFDITGAVITSPASRPLDIYPVHIENNLITVNAGNIIRRENFLKEQLVYAKKVKI